MTDQAKWAGVGGLLLIWAVVILLRLVNEPEPQRVPLTFTSGQVQSRVAGDLQVVRPVEARNAKVSFATPKNIFAPLDTRLESEKRETVQVTKRTRARPPEVFGPPAPPPDVLAAQQAQRHQELAAEAARRQQELAELQARQQREATLQQARHLMAQYRFLGYLTKGNESRAFLGKGREIYIVRAGDTVDGRIQVTSIDAATVKLKDAGTSLETAIPLTKTGQGPS
jgi:hypothetical protein